MMPTYKHEPELQDKGRFVQVDTRQLNEIKKIAQAPEVPKKPPEIIKLKEDQFAQKIGKRQITALSNEHRLATAAVCTVKGCLLRVHQPPAAAVQGRVAVVPDLVLGPAADQVRVMSQPRIFTRQGSSACSGTVSA
ncbi:MAG: hypothetical protein MZW92_27800 [Comamonadaceae bacterium]|nr:hypothetical protein [Comamonadaceae bacterium]